MENFKWEDDNFEISYVLKKALLKLENILLWQTKDTEKVILNGILLEHDEDSNSIILSKSKKSKLFEKDLPIYLKFITRSMLLKGKIKKENLEMIEISLPERLKMIENRNSKRNRLEHNENILMEKLYVDSIGKSRFSFELLDISDEGLGLKTSEVNAKILTNGDQFKLVKMQGKEIKIKLLYKLVHMSAMDVDRNGKISSYRVGMRKIEEGQ